jgi:hypothetical protein
LLRQGNRKEDCRYKEGWGKYELEFSIIISLIIENSDLTEKKFPVKSLSIYTPIKWENSTW